MVEPKRQLDSFFAKYDPAIAAFARRVRVKMRKRLPGALEMNLALRRAKVPLDPKKRRQLIIRSISAKQRHRRPARERQ